jgi:hypothetical protein
MVTSSERAMAQGMTGVSPQPVSAAAWRWLNSAWSGSKHEMLAEPDHGWIPARLRDRISRADEMLLDWARAPEAQGEDNTEHIRFALWLMRKADRQDRHRAAAAWPARLGIEPLEWMALRPDTDMATALDLFWKLGPAGYAKFFGEEETMLPHQRLVFMLLTEIRLLLAAGYYHRGDPPEIGYAPPAAAQAVDMRNDRNRGLYPPEVFVPVTVTGKPPSGDGRGFWNVARLFP